MYVSKDIRLKKHQKLKDLSFEKKKIGFRFVHGSCCTRYDFVEREWEKQCHELYRGSLRETGVSLCDLPLHVLQ